MVEAVGDSGGGVMIEVEGGGAVSFIFATSKSDEWSWMNAVIVLMLNNVSTFMIIYFVFGNCNDCDGLLHTYVLTEDTKDKDTICEDTKD